MPQVIYSPRPAHRWKPGRQVPALLLLTVALCMVPTVPTYADPPAAGSPDFVAIDAYLDREMRELRIPGLALGIVHDDEIVHLQAFGVADASGRAVTPQTPFILASASKSFTALAIMQLVEDGKVDLDAPVVTYLPSFSVGDESASTTITLRHLLNHTSGLSEDTAYEPMLSNDMSDSALSERVKALSDAELVHRPGEAFEYTDANYDTLGLIVEKVSGQSYEASIRERIFTPLGMSRSFTDQTEARQSGLASGHRSWFGFPRSFDAPYSRAAMPSSYLISSAEDVTHFLIGQLNGGTYDAASVLSPAGIAAMHQPAVREGDRDIFYGMGWESRTLAGVPVVRHKGTNANFYADMVLDKEGGWGVVILANFNSLNFNGGRLQGLTAGVLSLLKGEGPPEVPMPHHPLLASATLLIAAVTVLMLSSMVWSLATMRRWRTHPGRRPGRPWVLGLQVALSSVVCVGWGLGLLLIFPALAYPLAPTLLIVPDLGYLIVISSVVALVWGIARPPLTYITLRRRND
ncbi:MAG TPA: serine hydrolase domain-containing protein [Propionibacteriaceae bacterium]|nr:serine hydrolase domain-containing protein [Propionibacteriaceae bacterium]